MNSFENTNIPPDMTERHFFPTDEYDEDATWERADREYDRRKDDWITEKFSSAALPQR